jgi:hypothetical protein
MKSLKYNMLRVDDEYLFYVSYVAILKGMTDIFSISGVFKLIGPRFVIPQQRTTTETPRFESPQGKLMDGEKKTYKF